jgi:hypothetical protein
MTTIGRWSPSKVRNKIIDGSWVSETRYAMELVAPSSVTFSGTSADIVGNGSVDFSAVSSLSLNGVFSADYDNYMIVLRQLGSLQANMQIRLRASGTDATGSDYTRQYVFADGTSVSGARTSSSNLALLAGVDASLRTGNATYIYGPNLSQPTAARDVSARAYLEATILDYAWTHSLSTSYDGATFSPSSGNITGNVAVYGLRG